MQKYRSTNFSKACATAVFVTASMVSTLQAQEVNPANNQKLFATPDDAVKALKLAAAANDKTAMDQIFGPDYKKLFTGDPTQDANNAEHFANALTMACKATPDGDNKVILEIGTNDWPMPIPLVKSGGEWYFDTAAGKEEIIARHVGKDELHAVGICREFVKAQQQYSSMNAGPNGSYALQFKSSANARDGLYWQSEKNAPESPFSRVIADAETDGNINDTSGRPEAFHGYVFRILTRQGSAAPGGKKNYMSEGHLATGFALVAYPEHWDKSGIMTFIVNQDGLVYERNLGEKTSSLARKMSEYNPDANWTLVQEEGILRMTAGK